MNNREKPYQDYLDKEATIMGVLSAFAIGVAGLTVKEILSIEARGELFPSGRADVGYIVAGAALFVGAAAAFYWQRANLLWHYGQLALWASDEASSGQTLEGILKESDRWATWIPYQAGLALTAAGFVEYAGAFLPRSALLERALPAVAANFETWYVVTVLVAAFCVVGLIAVVRLRRDLHDTTKLSKSRRRLARSERPNKRLQPAAPPPR